MNPAIVFAAVALTLIGLAAVGWFLLYLTFRLESRYCGYDPKTRAFQENTNLDGRYKGAPSWLLRSTKWFAHKHPHLDPFVNDDSSGYWVMHKRVPFRMVFTLVLSLAQTQRAEDSSSAVTFYRAQGMSTLLAERIYSFDWGKYLAAFSFTEGSILRQVFQYSVPVNRFMAYVEYCDKDPDCWRDEMGSEEAKYFSTLPGDILSSLYPRKVYHYWYHPWDKNHEYKVTVS